ncbi:MAG: hypothetical protein ACYC2G_01765 [Gemmatimonadaceae bacterium]
MREHNVFREGFIAGVIGATSVALWFLFVDLVAAHPFYTPEVLGRSLLSVLGPDRGDSTIMVVTIYTIFHYAAFVVSGMIAVTIIHAGRQQSAVLAGALILFVAFEIGFYGLTAMLSESALGSLAWYQIGAANLIATILMGAYLWRIHPSLGRRLDFALGGRE